MMPWFGLLILYGLICLLFPCQGGITSPPDKTRYAFLPGQTANLTWTFDDAIPNVEFRSWAFANFNGKVVSLGTIYKNINADVKRTLYNVDIVKPATLVLKNVNQSYNGIYLFSLTVSGKAITNSVAVFIAKKPNVTLNCSSPVTLNKGDNFTCLCKGESESHPANVTWYKDGVKISEVGTKKKSLHLRNVGKADRGTYKCVAISYPYENYKKDKFIQVIVYFKPTNTVIKFSANPAVINGSITMQCISDGFPETFNTIYHNSTKVVSTDKRYTISQVKWEDAGSYKCIATNTFGEDSGFDILGVIEKPKPTILSATTSTLQSVTSCTCVSNGKVDGSEPKPTMLSATTSTLQSVTSSTCVSNGKVDGSGTGKPDKEKSNDFETKWYIVVAILVSGIFFGILLSYIFSRSCRKFKKRQPTQHANPMTIPQSFEVDSTYQELDLTKMNTEDNNYQSLGGNALR